jgi:hypothetical protein
MTEERKQHLWPWIVAVLIALPVLYVASFGPVCWLANRGVVNHLRVADAYAPLVDYSGYSLTDSGARALEWYGSLFAIDGSSGTLYGMQAYITLFSLSPEERGLLIDDTTWAKARAAPLFPVD